MRAATEADPDGEYLVADAAALPFEDASFDLVVSYDALMDAQDMPAAVHESARVLGPGARLCVCVSASAGFDAGVVVHEPDGGVRRSSRLLRAGGGFAARWNAAGSR